MILIILKQLTQSLTVGSEKVVEGVDGERVVFMILGVYLPCLRVQLFKPLLGEGSGPVAFKGGKGEPHLVSESLCLLNKAHADEVLDQQFGVT